MKMPDHIDQAQKKAIEFTVGAMELIAGPGSGKTFVTTHRIYYLLSELHIPPEQILVITFTKAAALEMQQRFYSLSSPDRPPVQFGTFHAVFYQIIRSYYKYSNVKPITENEKYKLIQELVRQKKLFMDEEQIREILHAISRVKNAYPQVEAKECPALDAEDFLWIMKEYELIMTDMGCLDFDDMVLLCFRCLMDDAEFRQKWQSRFRFILVDEFQDISPLQYEIIKLLAYQENNLFVVGDDDQSIYGFRGASPGIMKSFLTDYPNAVQAFLSNNYRSMKRIVTCAGKVIEENKDRFHKHIVSMQTFDGAVRMIASDDSDHAASVERAIRDCMDRKIPCDQIVVLCRRNRELEHLGRELVQKGLPVSGQKNIPNPYKASFITDFLTYMRFAKEDLETSDFVRIMNKPLRYIRRDKVGIGIVSEKVLLDAYQDNLRMKDMIEKMFRSVKRMESMSVYLKIQYIRKVIGYDRWMESERPEDVYAEYLRQADQVQALALECGSYFEWQKKLEHLADEFDKRRIAKNEEYGIGMMTYHASKGLQFDVVILPDLLEGMVPPKSSKTVEEIEEERRMFYVAMTRAKRELVLISSAKEDERSRFLRKIWDKKSG